jgi:hypothetical protein
VDLKTVREHGDHWKFDLRLTEGHLILELVDAIMGGIGVQKNI